MPQTPLNQVSTFSYKHIAAAGTVTVKAYGGDLDGIIVNSVSAASTLTLYDNTAASGTVIGIPSLATSSTAPFSISYNVGFATGLTIVTTGTPDVTIKFR